MKKIYNLPWAHQVTSKEKMQELQGKILVVDDGPQMRKALQTALRSFGFEAVGTTSVHHALQAVQQVGYDAVLLDISMPEMKSVTACLELRRIKPQLGILVLSVDDDFETKIQSLDAGADDYVTKPCHMGELAARLRSLIRRSKPTEGRNNTVIKIKDIELDPARRSVRRGAQPLHLTPKEFELLYYLMSNAGFPKTHAQLLWAVWGPGYTTQVEYLRTFVRQLRSKLGDSATRPLYLLTETHIGYRFRATHDDAP